MAATIAVGALFAGCGEEEDRPVPAVGKFCHELVRNGSSVTLTLVLGEGPGAVSLAASTGGCSTPLYTSCHNIPAGQSVLAQLWDGTRLLERGRIPSIAAGEAWAFISSLDEDDQPRVLTSRFPPGVHCSDLVPSQSDAERPSEGAAGFVGSALSAGDPGDPADRIGGWPAYTRVDQDRAGRQE